VNREPQTLNLIMKPPMQLDDRNHALHRFIERWWPWTPAERRLRSPHKKTEALRPRLEELQMAVATRAYHVETVPDERQSIWAWTVCGGPNKGRTALMVVAQDGTVRTVLPPEAKRPANRRRSRRLP
jgi:hypothetical protein